jgi:hypothetical protein
MSEFIETGTKVSRWRLAQMKAIRGLVLHHNVEVLPTQSDHYRPEEPEQPTQLRLIVNQPDNSFGYTDTYERLNAPDDAA